MTESDLKQIEILQNILSIFVKNNEHCAVHLDGETVVFDSKVMDVPFKNDLISAGATYDLARGCWTYWSNEE